MAKGFQVLKFVMSEFDLNWNRTLLPEAVVQYTATTNGADLAVVLEGATGVMTTYRFKVRANEVVYVSGQVIHVPALCSQKEPGNTIKCG